MAFDLVCTNGSFLSRITIHYKCSRDDRVEVACVKRSILLHALDATMHAFSEGNEAMNFALAEVQ